MHLRSMPKDQGCLHLAIVAYKGKPHCLGCMETALTPEVTSGHAAGHTLQILGPSADPAHLGICPPHQLLPPP